MGDGKKSKQIDFIVSTGDPNAASNSANRKRVRSVAALKSWPERRRKIVEHLESTGCCFRVERPEPRQNASSTTRSITKETAVQQLAEPAPPPSLPTRTSGSALTGAVSTHPPSPAVPRSAVALHHQAPTRVPATSAAVTQEQATRVNTPCLCPQCRHKRIVTNKAPDTYDRAPNVVPSRRKRKADGTETTLHFASDMAMITPPSSPDTPSGGRIDPFSCYPVPYQPWFDDVLHHMMTAYAPRGWPALNITNEQGVKWERFMMQTALSEPALFYVRLLFGSGDMVRLGTLRSEIQFWLHIQAIKTINAALTDHERACSDAMILAVGRIALHEHIYGDKYAASHVHRPAQKLMIEMRGGLKALEFPRLVKSLMRWSDRVMAAGSGTELMLEDDEANAKFTLRQSEVAMEKWAPHKMPAVRSRR